MEECFGCSNGVFERHCSKGFRVDGPISREVLEKIKVNVSTRANNPGWVRIN